MDINHFVYGDTKRIFVNSDMGCDSSCKYCYLPSLGIVHGTRKINAHQAIKLVEDLEYYVPGEGGSIISIGCYSECMDSNNIADTTAIVKYFVSRGNFVQLATKRKITRDFFEQIAECENIEERLWIYVSLPVITDFNKLEVGTDSPFERIKNFDLCKEYNINSVLYIKPYLNGITNQDIMQYCELVHKYSIPAVVGEMLSIEPTKNPALVGENRLFVQSDINMDKFIAHLCKNTKVYLHSVECMKIERGVIR